MALVEQAFGLWNTAWTQDEGSHAEECIHRPPKKCGANLTGSLLRELPILNTEQCCLGRKWLLFHNCLTLMLVTYLHCFVNRLCAGPWGLLSPAWYGAFGL